MASAVIQAPRQTLTSPVESLGKRPDMRNAIRILTGSDDMMEKFAIHTDNGISPLVEDLAVGLQLSHL